MKKASNKILIKNEEVKLPENPLSNQTLFAQDKFAQKIVNSTSTLKLNSQIQIKSSNKLDVEKPSQMILNNTKSPSQKGSQVFEIINANSSKTPIQSSSLLKKDVVTNNIKENIKEKQQTSSSSQLLMKKQNDQIQKKTVISQPPTTQKPLQKPSTPSLTKTAKTAQLTQVYSNKTSSQLQIKEQDSRVKSKNNDQSSKQNQKTKSTQKKAEDKKPKQNKIEEESKEITLQNDDFDQSISTNKLKFFEVFNEQTINKIMLFLELKDLSKFASFCRQSRKKIPFIIKKQKYLLKEYEKLKEKQYDPLNSLCRNIIQSQKQYKELLDKSQNQLIQLLKEFPKKKMENKDLLWDILHIGVNQLFNSTKKKEDIIDIILQKGIKQTFKDIEQGMVKPILNKTRIPDQPYFNKENPFTILIKLLYQHINAQQQIKFTLDQQKQGILLMTRFNYLQQFINLKDKFILRYQRPVTCLRKGSNIFEYLNKNNVQILIPFLKINEVNNLMLTNQGMNNLVKQGIQSILERLRISREQKIKANNMTNEQAQCIIYLQHFQVFQIFQQGLLDSHYFKFKPIKELLIALSQVILQDYKSIERCFDYKDDDYIQHYLLSHEIYGSSKEKIPFLESILSQYTDQAVEMFNEKKDYYRIKDKAIVLQKYLKGIKMFIELNLNKEQHIELNENYTKNLYPLDSLIYKYQQFIQQNQETLHFFTTNLKTHYSIRKTKGCPRYLFRDSYY